MAIPMMEEDVEVISKLGDTPGSDDGLTAQQLKGRFDLAGVRIKNFINNTLIPHLNQLVDVQALLNGILDSSLTMQDKAANAKAVGDRLSTIQITANAALPRSGGIMTGGINMNNRQLTGLATPVNSADGASKGYVDSRNIKLTVSLNAGNWTDGTQTVYAADILATDWPHYGVVYSDDAALREEEKYAFGLIHVLETQNGNLVFRCFEDTPSVDLTVQVEVNR